MIPKTSTIGALLFADEQLSIFKIKNTVITIFEKPFEQVITPLQERLRSKSSKLRLNGSDFLLYAVLDTLVDGVSALLPTCQIELRTLERQVHVDGNGHILDVGRLSADVLRISRLCASIYLHCP